MTCGESCDPRLSTPRTHLGRILLEHLLEVRCTLAAWVQTGEEEKEGLERIAVVRSRFLSLVHEDDDLLVGEKQSLWSRSTRGRCLPKLYVNTIPTKGTWRAPLVSTSRHRPRLSPPRSVVSFSHGTHVGESKSQKMQEAPCRAAKLCPVVSQCTVVFGCDSCCAVRGPSGG